MNVCTGTTSVTEVNLDESKHKKEKKKLPTKRSDENHIVEKVSMLKSKRKIDKALIFEIQNEISRLQKYTHNIFL